MPSQRAINTAAGPAATRNRSTATSTTCTTENTAAPNTPCNCCLLCKYHHHRAAHDPKIRLVMEPDGTLHITYADGTTETTIPPIRQPGLPWN